MIVFRNFDGTFDNVFFHSIAQNFDDRETVVFDLIVSPAFLPAIRQFVNTANFHSEADNFAFVN